MAHRSKKKHLKHVRQHEHQQQGSREPRGPESANRAGVRHEGNDGPRDLDEGGERTGARTRTARGARGNSGSRRARRGQAVTKGLVRSIARAATRSIAAAPARLLSRANDRLAEATGRAVQATSRAKTRATSRVARATSRVRSMLGRDA